MRQHWATDWAAFSHVGPSLSSSAEAKAVINCSRVKGTGEADDAARAGPITPPGQYRPPHGQGAARGCKGFEGREGADAGDG